MRYLYLLYIFFYLGVSISNAEQNESTKIDSLLSEIQNRPSDTIKSGLYKELYKEISRVNPERAVLYCSEWIDLTREIEFKRGEGEALYSMANAYYTLSKMTKAIEYYNKSRKIFEELNDQQGISNNLIGIGVIYSDQGEYTIGLEVLLNALRIKEKLQDVEGISLSYNNIGNIYFSQKNIPMAMEYYNKSLTLDEKFKKSKSVANTLYNMATIYTNTKDYKRALDLFEKLRVRRKKSNDQIGLSQCYIGIGTVYTRLNDNEKASLYLDSAEIIQEQIQSVAGLQSVYATKGDLYLNTGDYKKSLLYYTKSLELAKKIDALPVYEKSYRGLAAVYEKLGNFKDAYKYFVLFKQTSDNIFNTDNTQKLTEVAMKFEFDKIEQEQLLKAKEEELKTQIQIKDERNIRNTFIVGFSLLLVVVFLIYRNNKQKIRASQRMSLAYKEIEAKNKDITDSIHYAKRIQEAILPPESLMKQLLPESFTLYKPKDIVSGDFYWMEKWGPQLLIAAVDCTGHGVPGAFMSIVGHNALTQSVNVLGLSTPALILNEINVQLSKKLNQDRESVTVRDGMDIALIAINYSKLKIEFAGANNPLWIIRNNALIEISGDKFPIGAFVGEELQKFTNHEWELQKGDCIYIFTDGYADQFGGPKGKKFKYKQLEELLIQIHQKPFSEQKTILDETIDAWRGELDQLDDILIMGIKV